MNQRTLQNISYFASLPEMALSFLLPLYCIELGFSPLETTGLFAVVSLALLAAKWCIGGLCDRIGRKKVFQMGLLLKGISYGLLAYAHSAGLLYVGQVLKGVALALVSVSLYAMLSDQKTGAFAARQSRIAAAEGRGQLLGVLLAWVLLLATTFEQGWQILLLVGAVAAFYGAALAHRQLEETQGGAPRHGQKLPGKFYGLLTVSVWYSFGAYLSFAGAGADVRQDRGKKSLCPGFPALCGAVGCRAGSRVAPGLPGGVDALPGRLCPGLFRLWRHCGRARGRRDAGPDQRRISGQRQPGQLVGRPACRCFVPNGGRAGAFLLGSSPVCGSRRDTVGHLEKRGWSPVQKAAMRAAKDCSATEPRVGYAH